MKEDEYFSHILADGDVCIYVNIYVYMWLYLLQLENTDQDKTIVRDLHYDVNSIIPEMEEHESPPFPSNYHTDNSISLSVQYKIQLFVSVFWLKTLGDRQLTSRFKLHSQQKK